jgi:serine/threonine protein kinase
MEPPPTLPKPSANLPWIGNGTSSVVKEVSTSVVVKIPHMEPGSSTLRQLEIEAEIYERLGSHPNITKFIAFEDGNIYLERLPCTLQSRLIELKNAGKIAPADHVLLWASQIARAFKHIHSQGILQVDIATYNMLLDEENNVKLSDFAGSSIDGLEPAMCASIYAEHPLHISIQPSIHSELFAVGSAFYEIEALFEPYHDKDFNEIESLFMADQYPETSGLILGNIIRKCWLRQYKNAGEMLEDIHRVQMQLEVVKSTLAEKTLVEKTILEDILVEDITADARV